MSDIVERLRASYDPAKGGAKLGAEIYREAAAEIERLRAALREIAEHRIDSVLASREKRSMARAALEGDEALFPTKKICPECGQPMREGGYCDHIPF